MRHNKPDCGDWSLRSGLLLYRIFKCVFKLLIGNIFIVFLFDDLRQLSCGLLSGLDGIHLLYGMSRGFLLRHDRPLSSDGQLLVGIIFCCLRNSVFKLYCRVVLRHRWSNCIDG